MNTRSTKVRWVRNAGLLVAGGVLAGSLTWVIAAPDRSAVPRTPDPVLNGSAVAPVAPGQADSARAAASGTDPEQASAVATPPRTPEAPVGTKIVKSEAQWKQELTPEQFQVMRLKGTERAFTGKYWNVTDEGVYHCGACGLALFQSETKFDAGCGWPSFFKPIDGSRIEEHRDTTFGMERTEVVCSRCGAHLGHVFDDGPAPTGLRYCINSVSIELEKAAPAERPAPGAPASAPAPAAPKAQ